MSVPIKGVGNFLYRVTGSIGRFALLIVLAAVVLSGLFANYTINNLGINTNTTDMFAPELRWFQQFNQFREQFPQLESNVLVVLEGPIPEYVDQAQGLLAQRLQAYPETYGTVLAVEASDFFLRNGLLFLSEEELLDLGDRLAGMQPVIARLSDQPHLAGFLSLLVDSLDSELELPEELVGVLANLTDTFNAAAAGEPQTISWQHLLANASQQQTYRRVVLVSPPPNYDGAGARRQVLAGIRAEIAALDLSDEGVTARLTGSMALQQEELDSVSDGIIKGAIITVLLIVAILMVALRSWRLFAANLITLLAGLLLTAAFATFAIGHLNMISVAFAMLYIGLGIDFSIHYSLRYRELLHEGYAHGAAIQETSSDIGTSLVLCAITSSIGFLAFVPTSFSGVAELGLISGFGMFASLLANLILLPALLYLFNPPANVSVRSAPGIMHKISWLSTHQVRWVRLLALGLGLGSIALAFNARFDSNPINLRDPESESVRAYLDLMEEPTTNPLTLTVIASSNETATLSADLLALEEVGEVRQINDFVPAGQAQKIAILDDTKLMMGAVTPIELVPAELNRDLQAVREIIPLLNASDNEEERKLGAAMQAWLSGLSPGDQTRQLHVLSTAVLDTFPLTWNRMAAGLQAEEFTLEELPAALRSTWTTTTGDHRLEVIPQEPLISAQTTRQFIEAVESRAPNATGLPSIQYYGGQTVVGAFIQALGTAIGAVAILLLLLLRNLRNSLAIVVPLLLASAMTAAATVLFDLPFNFANVITLPLLIGVGVDNGVHMVHRHNQIGDSFDLVTSSTSRAILFSTMTTIVSFGSLAFSNHPGTASMGMVLTIGMCLSLLATLFVVPALLPKKVNA
ncbi:MAG: MMPL family transporter [Pseudomonadales bacterium]|nr:MMPL family transporter [Pseudomonadales bacterium]